MRILQEPALWQEAVGRTLALHGGIMPPIPRYDDFPWAAAVCPTNPLNLDIVFDDRYFMPSSELNLLNTLLLAERASVSLEGKAAP